MFDKIRFANIIKKIKDTYSSQEDFAEKSMIGRTYLSRYMNMKINEPPKPKLLQKLAIASNGIISYQELMEICGYVNVHQISRTTYPMFNITEYEWQLIFGYNKVIYLNNDEAFIWSEILETFHNDTNGHIFLNLNDFLEKCKNENEKCTITQLYYLFLLMITKFINKKGDYDSLISEIKKLNLPKMLKEIKSQYYMCPVYGQISAGQPNWAEENIEGRIPIDPNLMNIVDPEECFFLRVNGESMNKIIKNGAFALIHKQDYVNNGEIAVVLVNGDNATLKRFSKQGDIIVLTPESNDDSFKQQIYTKDTPIRIIGKYIGKMEINK